MEARTPGPLPMLRNGSVRDLAVGFGMALHYGFKPGHRQAEAANRYFRSVATALLDAELPEMTCCQYLVQEAMQKDLALREWKIPGVKDPLRDLVSWLPGVLHLLKDYDPDVPSWLPEVLDCGAAGTTCFIEVLDNNGAFTKREKSRLSLGLRAGRTVLLSTPTFILVELETGLLGMAVHDVGSWLIETLDDPVAKWDPQLQA